jgi:26S proteasome regulatory subunit N13
MAVGGPLFGGSTPRSTSKSLVEFRAGKMTLNAGTKMVSPDKRKGLVSVYQSDDQLMHLTWKDRGTGTLEDDLIIFPDDCEFLAVPACTTGRVFVLKFKTSNKRMFFWMQEPKGDKDEELCKKVNESLNQLPGSIPSGRTGAAGGLGGVLPAGLDFNNLGDSELQNLLNNMSQSQLMQLFGGSLGGAGGGNMQGLASLLGSSGGRSRQAAGTGRTRPTPVESPAVAATPEATPAAGAAAAGAANPNIQLSDLQSILSNIQVPPGGEAAGAGAGGPAVDMSSAMTLETLQPVLSNPEFLAKVKDFLPKDESTGKDVSADDLKGTVLSPQFKQAVSMFSMALQSGQLGPLVREFGLGDTAAAAAAQGDMLAFVKALQKDSGAGDGETKKKDEPEDMALD